MKIISVLTVFLFAVCATQSAEEVKLQTREFSHVEFPDVVPHDLWGIFTETWEKRTPHLFEDRLHSFRNIRWLTKYDGDSERYHRAVEDAAFSAFSKSLSYSAREAFLDSSLMEWFRNTENIFSNFVRDSIGGVEEEEIQSDDISFRIATQHWWQRLSENGVRYGVRPFRTSPYAFVSFHVGPHKNPHALVHTRYHFKNFSEHRVELVVSIKTIPDCQFDVGTSFRFERDEVLGFTMKLHRKIGDHSLLFVGADVRRKSEIFGGITLQW